MINEISCKECPTTLTVDIEEEGLFPTAFAAATAGWGYLDPDFYCPDHRIIVEAFATVIETDLDTVTLSNARQDIPLFKCPDCGATSPHPNDIATAYCFRCHEFKGDSW